MIRAREWIAHPDRCSTGICILIWLALLLPIWGGIIAAIGLAL